MNLSCWLVVQGVRLANYARDRKPGQIRVTKTKPNTGRDEIAVRLDVEIPDSLFDKPTLEARIQVPEGEARGPVITTEVADNLAEVIRRETGLTIHLSAGEEVQ